MNINWREVKHTYLNALTPKFGEREANSIFKLMIESFTGNFPPTSEDLEQQLTEQEHAKAIDILDQVVNDMPIHYVLGYAWFYDLKLNVNEDVLIPRQETEELVHWIIQDNKGEVRQRILDIGCGSGAIGLSLAKYTRMPRVVAGDISQGAVAVAKQNAVANEIENIEFMELDMLNLPTFEYQFDVIVSNPPYVDLSFKEKMPKNVIQHEPNIALFAPKGDELLFFRAIAEFALEQLKPEGTLYFEINEFYVEELKALLQQLGFSQVEAKKDMNGKWRMMKVQR